MHAELDSFYHLNDANISIGQFCERLPTRVKGKITEPIYENYSQQKFIEEVVHFEHQQFKLTAMRLPGLCSTLKCQHSLEGHIQIKHKDQAPIDDQSK